MPLNHEELPGVLSNIRTILDSSCGDTNGTLLLGKIDRLYILVSAVFEYKSHTSAQMFYLYESIKNLPDFFLDAEKIFKDPFVLQKIRALKYMLLYIRKPNVQPFFSAEGQHLVMDITPCGNVTPSGALDGNFKKHTCLSADEQSVLLSNPLNVYFCKIFHHEPFLCSGVITIKHMDVNIDFAKQRAEKIAEAVFGLHFGQFTRARHLSSRVEFDFLSSPPSSPSLPSSSPSEVSFLQSQKMILFDMRFLLSAWDQKIFQNHCEILGAIVERQSHFTYCPIILNVASEHIQLAYAYSWVKRQVSSPAQKSLEDIRAIPEIMWNIFTSINKLNDSRTLKLLNFWTILLQKLSGAYASAGVALATPLLATIILLRQESHYAFEFIVGCASAKDRTTVILATAAAFLPLLDSIFTSERGDEIWSYFTPDWCLKWSRLSAVEKELIRENFTPELLGYINLWSVGYAGNKAIPLLKEGFLKYALRDPTFFTPSMRAQLEAFHVMGNRI